MIKLWVNILKNYENLDAEQVVNLVLQFLCAVGSAFQSLCTDHRKHFQGCLTKEFKPLADNHINLRPHCPLVVWIESRETNKE